MSRLRPGDGGRGGQRREGQQVAAGSQRPSRHRASDQGSGSAPHLDLHHGVRVVGVGQKADVRVASAEGGGEALAYPPSVREEEGADCPVGQAGLSREQSTGLSGAVPRTGLDLVPASGFQDELCGGAPGSSLTLGQQPSQAPADALGEAPLQLEGPHARRQPPGLDTGGRGPVRERHQLDSTGQGPDRSVAGHFGGRYGGHRGTVGQGSLVGRSLQNRPPLVAHQPAPLVEILIAPSLLHWLIGRSAGGGFPHRREAEGEERVAVRQDGDTFGGGGEVSVSEGPQGVGAGRQRRKDELTLAVRQGDQASAGDPLAENGDDRPGHRGPPRALHPADEPPAILRADRRGQHQGGERDRPETAAETQIKALQRDQSPWHYGT